MMKIDLVCFWPLATLLILLGMGGCRPVQAPPAPAESARPANPPSQPGVNSRDPLHNIHRVQDHVWRYLRTDQPVNEGYGLYTYVLTGRNGSDTKASARYGVLVSLIQASTIAKSDFSADMDNSRLNIFLIPAKKGPREDRPDQELAMALLLKFTLDAGQDFSGPGPYLLSVQRPLLADASNNLVDMLYVDLSKVHEKTFPELVRAYKDRVVGSGISGVEQLSSFRIDLLNAALIAEDSIGLIKTAEALLRDSFAP